MEVTSAGLLKRSRITDVRLLSLLDTTPQVCRQTPHSPHIRDTPHTVLEQSAHLLSNRAFPSGYFPRARTTLRI